MLCSKAGDANPKKLVDSSNPISLQSLVQEAGVPLKRIEDHKQLAPNRRLSSRTEAITKPQEI